jgi:hypothetical protein
MHLAASVQVKTFWAAIEKVDIIKVVALWWVHLAIAHY